MELTLFVEHQCNLRCSYCYNGDKFTRSMSSETMKKSVALALSSRPRHLDVSFFGGEPLLRLELVREAIEHVEAEVARLGAERPTLRFLVNTNATLIDDEALELFAPPRRVTVFASLDGPRDVHDARRVNKAGRGSFDAAVAGIARLRARKIPVQIVCVVRKDSAHRLGEAMAAALELGPEKITFSPDYRDDWTEEGILRLERGLADVADAWIELFRQGRVVLVDPLHSKILSHIRSGIPCAARCQLAAGELTVAPSGRIYPCAQMVGEDDRLDLVIGHVDTGIDQEAARRLQTAKDRVEVVCADCDLRDRCQSHCGCKHIGLTGQLGEITLALCETESAFVAAADRVAERLFAEQNPTFVELYYRRAWQAAPGAQLTELRRSRDEAQVSLPRLRVV